MKFARYLEETQIPEWKKAYIDYRGLKKCITAIRRAKDNDGAPASPRLSLDAVTTRSSRDGDLLPSTSRLSPLPDGHKSSSEDEPTIQSPPPVADRGRPRLPHGDDTDSSSQFRAGSSKAPERLPSPTRSNRSVRIEEDARLPRTSLHHAATLNMGMLPKFRKRSMSGTQSSLRRNAKGLWEVTKGLGGGWDLNKSIPLTELMPQLTRLQIAFFDKLDVELEKVEVFYEEREKDMKAKTVALNIQLNEMEHHRKRLDEAHPRQSWLPLSLPLVGGHHKRGEPSAHPASRGRTAPHTRKRRRFKFPGSSSSATVDNQKSPLPPVPSPTPVPASDDNATLHPGTKSERSQSKSREESSPAENTDSSDSAGKTKRSSVTFISASEERIGGVARRMKQKFQSSLIGGIGGLGTATPTSTTGKFDPDDYLHAKKRLKKAVLECYRGLEVLNNYRTLNVIGFGKALKKFEKCTKIPARHAYTTEKIEPNAFSSGAAVEGMIHEIELLYAAHFTRGDKKKAQMRLRGGTRTRNHHWSTFCSGMMIGLAIPAFVDGIYHSFQPDTREAIPGWDGLLYVYSVFLVPVVFVLLVGLNMAVWSTSRINYVFIFELDLRTKIDYRQYFEIPAFLFSTLCYALWLSFNRIGSNSISPTHWPLFWLLLVVVLLLNPLPILYKSSRWWLLKNTSRLLTSGAHRVEFTDFWMGDQFCSLVFTLSNLYLVACVYSDGGLDESWRRCSGSRNKNWGVPFLLGSLPLLVRAVQSVKRWVDSGLGTHLINGGKYTAGIIYYLCYFHWRHSGGQHGPSFVAWCIFGTIYSVYASSWDLLMDWSLLRPHATHKLLRDDLLYTNYIPTYYFAIISNVLIRFIWVFYIPVSGPNFFLRTFIAGVLEILRRWQWNFYRLENEHIGNMDQYRVTREVPLPYSIEDAGRYSDDDDDDDSQSRKSTKSLRWRRKRGQSSSTGASPEQAT